MLIIIIITITIIIIIIIIIIIEIKMKEMMRSSRNKVKRKCMGKEYKRRIREILETKLS